ncbi:hypothetical protein Lal_00017781 [Lupinus albus]|nr:hypothetical protein Lal_00017781 [Lupinus albus]
MSSANAYKEYLQLKRTIPLFSLNYYLSKHRNLANGSKDRRKEQTVRIEFESHDIYYLQPSLSIKFVVTESLEHRHCRLGHPNKLSMWSLISHT